MRNNLLRILGGIPDKVVAIRRVGGSFDSLLLVIICCLSACGEGQASIFVLPAGTRGHQKNIVFSASHVGSWPPEGELLLSCDGFHRGEACKDQRVLHLDKIILATGFGPVGGESEATLLLARQGIASCNGPWAHRFGV